MIHQKNVFELIFFGVDVIFVSSISKIMKITSSDDLRRHKISHYFDHLNIFHLQQKIRKKNLNKHTSRSWIPFSKIEM